jgi:hypothetical protein
MYDPMLFHRRIDLFRWSIIKPMSTIDSFEASVGNTALVIALPTPRDACQNCFTMRTTGSVKPFVNVATSSTQRKPAS